ncbi:tRNA pseudouridine(38-40) synthase TruA [Ectothiorhodospiraceae bacterium WFHF3C12]|nr:tRNA pseudouridine(38-40) synthase TruA [Ectothiorhodospiraceae bacterium WFHF3C12]
MARFAIGIAYDGSGYMGWQRQRHGASVQAMVEKAASRVADEAVEVICAGRTDAGVHATHQVAHFDSGAERPLHGWLRGINSNLPGDIAIQWIQPAAPEFHARFSATGRCYRYVIYTHPVRPALHRNRVSWTYRPLALEPMRQAARHLVGEHDFSSFRAVACQARHPVREVREIALQRSGAYIYLDVNANAFLHHMVRNIAGVLMSIGAGERPPEWCRAVLEARDRTRGGVTAPGEGLYLTGVDYPAHLGIPSRGELPVFAP